MKKLLAVLGVLLLTVPAAPATPQSPPPGSDPELEAGIQQVREGEFDAALITLDGVVRRLTAEQNLARSKELARAYVYLGVAYLRLNQTEAAKAQFLEALDLDEELAVTAAEFPPGVVDLFGAVKAELERTRQPAAAAAPTPAPPPPSGVEPAAEEPGEQIEPAAPEAKKKGGSKTVPILLGVGGAAAVAALLGGTTGPEPPTPANSTSPVTPATTLAELSATVTSPQMNARLVCTEHIGVTLQLTNRGRSSVSIQSVRVATRVRSGSCTGGDGSRSPLVSSAGAGQTVTVYSTGELFSSGSGCCNANSRCDGSTVCEFETAFFVATSVGEVNAGGVGYATIFKGCVQCTSSSSLSDCNPSIR